MQNLSEILRVDKQHERAITLAEEAVQLSRKVLEKDDLTLIRANENLSRCYLADGQAERALQVAVAAQKSAVEYAGWESQLTLQVTTLLADCLRNLGRFEEALQAQQQCYDAAVSGFGASHQSTIYHQSKLADLVYKCGETEKALELQREATAATREMFGRSIRTFWEMRELSGLLQSAGKHEEALSVAEGAMALFPESLPEDQPARIDLLDLSGKIHHDLGDHEKALSFRQEALELSIRRYGEVHPNTARKQGGVANAFKQLGLIFTHKSGF